MDDKETVYIPNVGVAEVSDYIPTSEEEKMFNKFEQQAEKDIEAIKQTANVHFRWSEFEVKRAKRIAQKLGMPYQTYLKFTLKQAMDKDELKFM
jgi:predicted DNA binding CopG/RHH family protein